jgi:hypothetical protein
MAISDNFTPRSRPEKFRQRKSVAGIDDAGRVCYRISFTPPRTSSRANELCMPTCEVCENEYDKAFEVAVGGERHTFDSFECAIHELAPVASIATAVSSATASRRTEKSSVVSAAHARPAQRS